MFTFFISKFQAAPRTDFDKCIQLLNDIGVFMWFNIEGLEEYIFNDIGSVIEMLKVLFVHDMEMLSHGNLCGVLDSCIVETDHNDNLNKLTKEGILVCGLLPKSVMVSQNF
jgi:hypothetical protein